MRAARSTLLLTCLVALLFVQGCSGLSHASASSLTAGEAKKQTQAMERKIAGFVPEEFTAKVDQLSRGSFLSCATGGIQWTGQTLVYFKGQPPVASVLQRIEDHWNGRDGYESSRENAGDGTLSVVISGQDSAAFLVGPVKSYQYLQLLSFSPCFPAAGEAPGDFY